MPRPFTLLLTFGLICWAATAIHAQLSRSDVDPDHPAILYGAPSPADAVGRLDERLAAGRLQLQFEPGTGFLRSLLSALDIPIESQIVVFSKTSLQSDLITPRNPRSIFFNDSVAVAWMRGGLIEIAAHDARQGAAFYLIPQAGPGPVRPVRDNGCVRCHYSAATLGVPGFILRSIPSGADGSLMPWLGNYTTTHRSPIEERWGGWYVTGRSTRQHLGNAPVEDRTATEPQRAPGNVNVSTLADRFDTGGYLAPHSDIVALLVFDHQVHMMNLLTRMAWETRVLAFEKRTPAASAEWREGIVELVDYLLFVDEADVGPVQGSSGFAERFAATGPRDRRGRSLRDLDLRTRLFTYRCSYMIYSEAFDALPSDARAAIYRRLWDVLSGAERADRYARLSAADRGALIEILRDTKKDLPPYYSTTSQSP